MTEIAGIAAEAVHNLDHSASPSDAPWTAAARAGTGGRAARGHVQPPAQAGRALFRRVQQHWATACCCELCREMCQSVQCACRLCSPRLPACGT